MNRLKELFGVRRRMWIVQVVGGNHVRYCGPFWDQKKAEEYVFTVSPAGFPNYQGYVIEVQKP